MKFDVSPKELLALHDLLHANVLYQQLDTADAVQLQSLYGRIRSIIISSLSPTPKVASGLEPFERWRQNQQAKIAKLEEDLKSDTKSTVMSAGDDFSILLDGRARKRPITFRSSKRWRSKQ